MFYQILLSPQKKRCAIISYKYGIYRFPNELPNDVRLRKLGNIGKVSKLHRTIAQLPRQNENFANSSKKVPENSN